MKRNGSQAARRSAEERNDVRCWRRPSVAQGRRRGKPIHLQEPFLPPPPFRARKRLRGAAFSAVLRFFADAADAVAEMRDGSCHQAWAVYDLGVQNTVSASLKAASAWSSARRGGQRFEAFPGRIASGRQGFADAWRSVAKCRHFGV